MDTETTGVGFDDVPFCATLTWRRTDGELNSAYIDLEEDERRDILRDLLTGTVTWVMHNAKFDLGMIDRIGALPPMTGHIIEDTQPLAALLDENRRLALKSLAIEELGWEDSIEVEISSGPNKGKTRRVPREEYQLAKVRRKLKLRKEDGYHLLPREVLIPYALADTEMTLRLWEKLRPQLPEDLEPVYAEELALIHALRKMEANGIGIDVTYLERTRGEYGIRVMELWQKLVELTGEDEFNPNSVPQVKAAFARAGTELESTDKATIRDLLAGNPPDAARDLATTLRDYREAEKIYATYLRPLAEEQRDGIVHPWLNNVGPRTGRMSSSRAAA